MYKLYLEDLYGKAILYFDTYNEALSAKISFENIQRYISIEIKN